MAYTCHAPPGKTADYTGAACMVAQRLWSVAPCTPTLAMDGDAARNHLTVCACVRIYTRKIYSTIGRGGVVVRTPDYQSRESGFESSCCHERVRSLRAASVVSLSCINVRSLRAASVVSAV